MPIKLLIDTDVLIDFLRGRSQAVAYLENLIEESVLISSITVAELYSGVREGKEREVLDTFFLPLKLCLLMKKLLLKGDYIAEIMEKVMV